jgi:agmatinase
MIAGPWFGLAANEGTDHADLVVFGVPFDRAVFFRRGAAEGPARIRALSSKLPPTSEVGARLDGRRILDLHDVDVDEGPGDTDGLHERIRALWLTARSRGFPLALGGDHSISIPILLAAADWVGSPARTSGTYEPRSDLGIVWIDAHPDLCDLYDGSRLSHACVMRRALEHSAIRPEHVVMLGVRSFEVEEITYIHQHALPALTAHHLARRDAEEVGAELVDRFGRMPVYLSIDADAFDPAYAPGTGIPDAGGLSARWVLDLLHALEPLNLIGADIVEVAPPLDAPSDVTSLLALKLILEVLGILGDGASSPPETR